MAKELWRIESLCDKAIALLQQTQYGGPGSARVRELPDIRTIRYYTTVGLVDRCSEMRGRTAYYGRRHLLQLIAIKRLQAEGLSLVDIQQKVIGAKDAALKKLAGVNENDLAAAVGNLAPSESAAVTSEPITSTPRARFWEGLPQQTGEPDQPAAAEKLPRPAVILPVTSGVALVLENISPKRLAELLPALQAALEPVRHVIQQIQQGEDSDTHSLQPLAGSTYNVQGNHKEKPHDH